MNRTGTGFRRLTPEQQRKRRQRLADVSARRRYWRDEDMRDPGPRCGVCWLLQPHVCLDGMEIRS